MILTMTTPETCNLHHNRDQNNQIRNRPYKHGNGENHINEWVGNLCWKIFKVKV